MDRLIGWAAARRRYVRVALAGLAIVAVVVAGQFVVQRTIAPATGSAATGAGPAATGADRRLSALIQRFGHHGEYAVFDADNTIWQYDLEEALLPYLENAGVLSRRTLDPSLKLIPFKPHESLYSYYSRLCEVDDLVCYPWIAQVFSGLTIRQLKVYVDRLFALRRPIPTTYYDGDTVVRTTVNPPRIYPAQRRLVGRLERAGIRVYVVTAAHEELVRMVASDPRYGLNVRPADVIGVNTLLKNPRTGALTTARKQIKAGHFYDATYPRRTHESMIVTPYLWTPASWYVGKQASIQDYIDPYRRPVLAAGDSPSDWFMLFYADVHRGGLRLWVNRKQEYTDALAREKVHRQHQQRAAGVAVDATRGWLVRTPAQLG